MNKNANPELSAKWWSANLPDGLDSAKDLEKAVADAEAARGKLDKEPAAEAHLAAVLKALAHVEAIARKAQDEAARLVKSPPKKGKATAEDYQATADVLKKFGKALDTARAAATELAGKAAAAAQDDEEDGGGMLGDEEAYKRYLKKLMGKLGSRSMNFAFGMGTDASEHRFLFHGSRSGSSLMADLKKGTALKRYAWGVAGAHAERAGTLVLALESPQAPGLRSKAGKLLKVFKPLPFDTVLLMVEGQEVADIADPDEQDEPGLAAPAGAGAPPLPAEPPPSSAAERGAAFNARLAALLPAIQKALAAKSANAEAAKLKASEAAVLARKRDFDAAEPLLAEAQALLESAPAAPAAAAVPPAASAPSDAQAAYVAARDQVLAEVRKVAAAFAATKDPLARPAIIELQSIVKNLAGVPGTPQQAAEIERYLQQDDVIAAAEQVRPPFGSLSIRRPLLKALSRLR